MPANKTHGPRYAYRCKRCGMSTESQIRETLIWSCPCCVEDETLPVTDRNVPMYRVYHAPNVPHVWTEQYDLTSGTYVSDYKKMRALWRKNDDIASERRGSTQTTVEVDPSDRDSIGVTEQGLDSTHDAHVKMGFKESKGKFVF